MSSSPRKIDDNQKLLIEIIKRFDTYINASNAKAAIILSYCMAYIAGLGLKIVDISDKRANDLSWNVLIAFYFLSVIFTLWSAYLAYKAIEPQLPSGNASNESLSVIFFGDIASNVGGRDGYLKNINELTDDNLLRDLSIQAHTLAVITNNKFVAIKKSTKLLFLFQIPLFAVIIVILLVGLRQVPIASDCCLKKVPIASDKNTLP